ncbi:nucleotidyltransferase family protein [Stackebrandtia nassauensis]|uniref:4-diphosphocytidyl-2C-methyl-D-erythritol synthase n=1 Tax=Stackebrandtia nassauensis (strain DSM 44728 / CIP 108903 / NRRL B-16338 / NBRC 102104 / LLR-40K-21) TaxID=446470 RepID=D3Q640_STANL|nr:nucleotidyltransferase family protein [Stackebrandtia nassauensis]ADD42215.1 4-diphosphocytidyl-2C-methyl-D-erythritol synthase [Stackebrandtia nassauensis DSM 44728]
MSVAGLVLAAGAGTRFGRPKALVEYRGATLLDRAVTILREGGCETVYGVLGISAYAARARSATAFTPVYNPRWHTGMGSSLRAGLAALDREHEGVVVLLVDQPGISPVSVRRVREAHALGALVAMAVYNGRRGHPVCFDRGLWPEIAEAAHDDVGAREFLRAHPDLITEVACDGLGDPRDIDTPADLARLRRR